MGHSCLQRTKYKCKYYIVNRDFTFDSSEWKTRVYVETKMSQYPVEIDYIAHIHLIVYVIVTCYSTLSFDSSQWTMILYITVTFNSTFSFDSSQWTMIRLKQPLLQHPTGNLLNMLERYLKAPNYSISQLLFILHMHTDSICSSPFIQYLMENDSKCRSHISEHHMEYDSICQS